jgi:antitoxin component YwqK of YwqJK toxin-antitoxin module
MEVLSDLKRSSRSAFKPFAPRFTYANGVLTRIDYADGSYKLLTYLNGNLASVSYVSNGITVQKTFSYSNGVLASVAESVI